MSRELWGGTPRFPTQSHTAPRRQGRNPQLSLQRFTSISASNRSLEKKPKWSLSRNTGRSNAQHCFSFFFIFFLVICYFFSFSFKCRILVLWVKWKKISEYERQQQSHPLFSLFLPLSLASSKMHIFTIQHSKTAIVMKERLPPSLSVVGFRF